MSDKYPHPNDVGVFPERRSLHAWSTHPGEQEAMAAAGWVQAFEMPVDPPRGAPEDATNFTAKLFVKGPFALKKETLPDVEPAPEQLPEPQDEPQPAGDDDALTPES